MARSLLVVLLVLLAACEPTAVSPTTAGKGDTVIADLVVDGDTFESAEGREFRLDGINAPEFDECHYDEATSHLTGLIEGAPVSITVTGTDQFGRTLAQVRIGEVWVNLDLVTRGLAMATTPREGDYDDLVAAEDLAFEDRAGLWAVDACGGAGPIPRVRVDREASVVNPPGPDEEDLSAEQITVTNEGSAAVDLTGWTIRDESSRHRYRFAAGTVLAPGGAITVSSADHGWDPGNSPVWNNSGDLALILDSFGRVVDRFRY